MFWQILPHTSACIAADRVYLLDVRRDRYLMVPARLSGTVGAWLRGPVGAAAPQSFVALLREAGTLVSGDGCPQNGHIERVDIPDALTVSAAPERATLMTTTKVFRLVLRTSIALKHCPLAKLIQSACLETAATESEDFAAQASLARRYDAARRFVPIKRRCLLDSLALRAWLHLDHQRVQLVFGVAPAPFVAHCWLQNGVSVLNDSYDRVSCFTPILAI